MEKTSVDLTARHKSLGTGVPAHAYLVLWAHHQPAGQNVYCTQTAPQTELVFKASVPIHVTKHVDKMPDANL